MNVNQSTKKIRDIKTIFDGLRNVGICSVFLIAANNLLEEPVLFFGSKHFTSSVVLCLILFFVALMISNFIWLFYSLKAKSYNTAIQIFGVVIYIVVALVAVIVVNGYGLINTLVA